MASTILAVLGAGSVRCSPPVIAALASYFGERPLEIRLYDSDEERLDLFDRFARACFNLTKATHALSGHLDPKEALDNADRVVLQVGTNCARKYLRASGKLKSAMANDFQEPAGSLQKDGYLPLAHDTAMIQDALQFLLPNITPDSDVLSLQEEAVQLPVGRRFRRTDWPPEPTLAERVAIPHQVLRWIKGEEYPHALIAESERSPLKAWLDDVKTAAPIRP